VWALQATRPGGWWYAVAGAVFLAGVAAFVWLLLSGITGAQKGFQRGVAPGQIQLQLDTPGTYVIFYEFQSVMDGKVYSTADALPPLSVSVAARDSGATVAVAEPTMSQNYSLGSRSGRSILAFEAGQPGTYILTAAYPRSSIGPEIVLAVGQGFGSRLMATILGSIATLFGSLALAVVIAVITFVKRGRTA
jgi:hypothetical protein